MMFRNNFVFFLCISMLGHTSPETITLKCLSNDIEIEVETASGFSGAIYTLGSFRQNGCHVDGNFKANYLLRFPLRSCLTNEESKGVFTNVIVVQHEDHVVTADDSSFEIQCVYKTNKKNPASSSSVAATISKSHIYQLEGAEHIRVGGKTATLVTNGTNVAVFRLSEHV